MTKLPDWIVDKAALAECNVRLAAVGYEPLERLPENDREAGRWRAHARIILATVADDLRAEGWARGYADSEREWKHVYDGHTIDPDGDDVTCMTCGIGNPYRTDKGGES